MGTPGSGRLYEIAVGRAIIVAARKTRGATGPAII